jgi:hypothetical protein
MTYACSKTEAIDFIGNIVPHKWYSQIKFSNGKPDLIAITLLSEIVYWYRPRHNDGSLSQKKFKADILQKSYQELADKFCLTKRQVTEATNRLESRGLIKKIFRNIKNLSNVLFIDINTDEILKISNVTKNSESKENVKARQKCEKTYPQVSHPNVPPLTLKRETYTKITTKNKNNLQTIKPILNSNFKKENNIALEMINVWKNKVGETYIQFSSKKVLKLLFESLKNNFDESLEQWSNYCDKLKNLSKPFLLWAIKEQTIKKIRNANQVYTTSLQSQFEYKNEPINLAEKITNINNNILKIPLKEIGEGQQISYQDKLKLTSGKYELSDCKRKLTIKTFYFMKNELEYLNTELFVQFKKHIPDLESISYIGC